MFAVKYKVMKVKRDGVSRFVPVKRVSFLGFGKWQEDPDWEKTQKLVAEERLLGLATDSTLTQCRAFIEKKDPAKLKNRYYKDK